MKNGLKIGVLVFLVIGILMISGCTGSRQVSTPTVNSDHTTVPVTAATTSATMAPPLTSGGTCRQGLTWCNGHCSDLSVDIGDCGACSSPCGSGQACVDGQCCERGLALCNGSCSDLTNDEKNCGRCGNICPDGWCVESRCLNMNFTCPSGETACFDERCHDLTSDNMNCGHCGKICPVFSGCMHSVCVGGDDTDSENIVINMPV